MRHAARKFVETTLLRSYVHVCFNKTLKTIFLLEKLQVRLRATVNLFSTNTSFMEKPF